MVIFPSRRPAARSPLSGETAIPQISSPPSMTGTICDRVDVSRNEMVRAAKIAMNLPLTARAIGVYVPTIKSLRFSELGSRGHIE